MSTVFCMLMLLPQSTLEVEDLVRNLDADRYSDRRAAAQRLTEMGPSVFDDLVKAAQGSSAEVQRRSLDILQGHFQNGEATVREAAKKALEDLAKTETPAGRQAKLALNPAANTLDPNALRKQQMAQQIQIALQARNVQAAQRIRINGIPIQANGNAQRRIQFSNGKKTVKIQMNGPKITMEITEKDANGKSTTKKYEAKNEAELKQKHPNAYKEYKQHTQGRPGINAFGRPAPIQLQIPNIQKPRPAAIPAIPVNTQKRILESLKRSEKLMKDQMERAKNDLEGAELQRAMENFERRLKSLERTRQRYEARANGDAS